MKNIKETDRIIRGKLRNHVVEMPDHLWDKIDAQRNATVVVTKESSRSKWLLLLLLLLGGAAGTWTMLPEKTIKNANHTDGTSNQTMAIVAPTTATKDNTTSITIENQKSTTTSTSTAGLKTAARATEITAMSGSSTARPENEAAVSDLPQKTIDPRTKAASIKTMLENKSPYSSTEDEDIIAFAKGNNSQTPIVAPTNAGSMTDEVEGFNANANASAQTVSKATELGDRNAIKDGSFLKDIMYLPNELISLTANPLPLGALPDPKCAKFGNGSFGFDAYLDWYISPDYAFRSLKAKDVEYLDDAAQRDKTEGYLYAYSTGIRFSAVAENGLAFRSGIAYSQINEKFDYLSGNETRISIKNVFDADGNVISSDTTLQTGTHVKTSYNRYRMIDIPLIAGYEVDTKNFVYSMNAGVYLNLLFTQKGDFIHEGRPTNFTSNRSDSYRAFKDKLGFSLFGSFGFNYKLSKNMQILIEPHVRYHLNPVNTKEYPIEQRYLTAGLITGVRFKF